MNDLDEFAEVALAIFVALTLLIWLLTYLERTISRPLTEKRTRHPTEKKSRAARQQLASQVNTLDPSIHRWKRSSSRVVRDEFQEAAVGIPEVDADPLTLGAKPRNRAGLNLDAMLRQVSNRVLDRSRPPEAQVAVARLHREPSDVCRQVKARPMHI